MPDIPARQKVLLIAMIVVAAIFVWTYLPSGDEPEPTAGGVGAASTGFTAGRPSTQQSQAGRQTQQPVRNRPVQTARSIQSTRPGLDLELRDDPFSRPPKATVTSGAQGALSPLANLNFQGIFGKTAIFNDAFYKVGESVMGYTIVEIKLDRVILRDSEGKQYILR